MKKAVQNSVKVVVRCRPLNKEEKKKGLKSILECDYNRKEVSIQNENEKLASSYYFDKVFNSTASQEFLYRSVVADVVEDTLKGFNCTVFAYGQTGTGKTYTMEGNRTVANKGNSPFWYGEEAGMIPRAAQQIFQHLEACEKIFTVFISCLELYNEEVIDLLTNDGKPLHIRDEASGKGVVVSGLQEIQVRSPEEIFKLLEGCSRRRHTAETLSNQRSSRSHCIFTITVHSKEAADNGEDLFRTGKLNLVDLAGSENTKRSGATGEIMKQAAMINKSLLTLRRVITALSSGKKGHIPFRDSKLTRLLQESLGGQAKTCMIATISPSIDGLEESRSTLQYALSAKNIKNTPVVYEKLTKKAKIKEFEEEINSLRDQLAASCADDGCYVDSKTWQQHLQNVEKFKELSTNLENQEIHISQLEKQSSVRSEELSQREEESKQCKNDLDATLSELAVVTDEYDQSSGKIADQKAIVYFHKQTALQLQDQAKDLEQQAQTMISDVKYLHQSIERYQQQLDEFDDFSARAQEKLCKKITKIIQNLSTFQTAHQQHASKLSSSWNTLFQSQTPFKETLNNEKEILSSFVTKQIEIAKKLINDDFTTQKNFNEQTIQNHLSFINSLKKQQKNLFADILKYLDTLSENFVQFVDKFSSSFESFDGQQKQYVDNQLEIISNQHQIHRNHYKSLQSFSKSQNSKIFPEQQNMISSICDTVDSIVQSSHQKILSDIQKLLEENAQNQSKILRESLQEISSKISDEIPKIEKFEAKQGTTILASLENLKSQRKSFNDYQNNFHKKIFDIIDETSTSHESFSEYHNDLKSFTNDLEEKISKSWNVYEEWKNSFYNQSQSNVLDCNSTYNKWLNEYSSIVEEFFNTKLQEPINSWNDYMERNEFLDTVVSMYSKNDEFLNEEKNILMDIDNMIGNLTSELKHYNPSKDTPKKEKEYTLPSTFKTPELPRQKAVRKLSGKRPLRNSNAQPTVAQQDILKRKKSTLKRSTSSHRVANKNNGEPNRKRRRIAGDNE